jgi:hypothetical protein
MASNTALAAAPATAARPLPRLSVPLLGVVLTCWPIVPAALLLSDGRGLVLTARWSAALAGWVLCLLTVVLHLLVRRTSDPTAGTAVAVAAARADRERQTAADLGDVAHHLSAVSDPDSPAAAQARREAQQAATVAVAAAAHRAAAVVRSRRSGLKSLVVGADGRASTC